MPVAGHDRTWPIWRSCPVVADREREELAPAPAPKAGSAAFGSLRIKQTNVEGVAAAQARVRADPLGVGTLEVNLANPFGHGERQMDVSPFLPWLEAPGQDKVCGRVVLCRVQG